MDGETQGGGYGQLASLALPIAAGAASFIRPQAAYPLISLAQMAETAGYRDALLKEKADQRAQDENERAAFAAHLKSNFGIDVDPAISASHQASFATLAGQRAKDAREQADKQAQRLIGGGLAQVSNDLPATLPDDTLAGLNALLAKSGGAMTEQQERFAKDIRTDAEKLRGGIANARAFETPFRTEQVATFGELPPAPEPPGTFSLTTNEGTDPLLASLKEFLPTGLPEPPAPLRYSTVDPKAMPFSESITRGGKAPSAEDMFAAGLPADKIPGGDKLVTERAKASADLAEAQRKAREGELRGQVLSGSAPTLTEDQKVLIGLRAPAPGKEPGIGSLPERLAKELFGVGADQLHTLTPQQIAQINAREQGLMVARGAAGAQARQDVELTGPIGKEAENYTNPVTLTPPSPAMSKRAVYNSFLPVPVKAVQAYKTIGQTLTEARDVISRRPDLFPPSTSNVAADAAKVGMAQAKYWATSRTDPDVAIIEGLKATVPLQVRTFGDNGNIAVAERDIATNAAGLGPATRERVLSSLNLIDRLVSQSGSAAGLPALSELQRSRPGTDIPPAPGEPPKSLTAPKPGRTLRFDAKGNLIP